MNKFSIKNYWKPTPRFYRELGDAILYVGGIATTTYIAVEIDLKTAMVLLLILVGKFLSNWFKV